MRFVSAPGLLLLLGPVVSSAAAQLDQSDGLTIESPQEYQVVQREEINQGAVPLRVRFAALPRRVAQWEIRVDPSDSQTTGSVLNGGAAYGAGADHHVLQTELCLPGGGWYRLSLRGRDAAGNVVAEGHVARFGVGEVFIVAGQSNAANHGAVCLPTKTGLVSSFDGQKWRLGNDPQPGASGSGGSFMPALADELSRRLAVPIGIVAIAQGATSVREWLPKGTPIDQLTTTGAGVLPVANGKWESNGELFQRLTRRFAALGPYGFRAVLWHQGESDAGQARSGYPAERQISGDDYVRYMRALIEGSQHAAGWNVPWITAVTTYHSEEDAADAEFRTAQKSLSTLGLSHEGPDTDTLRAEFRDGVHFNEKGLRRHGAMWAEKVANWLDQSLKLHTAEDSVIRFDGRLDEPLWKRAAIVRDFSFPWSDKPAPATEFRSTVLGDRLYFAFTVVDNDLIVVTDWINESTLNGEDRVEVFFARDAELKEYYCIEIDPLGRVHDYAASFYRHFDSQWNCPGLQTSARRTSEGYVVEAAVPLAALTDLLGKPIAPGTSLRVGLFRAEFHGTSRGESGDDWLSHVRPATELPDFHVPSAFRMWTVPN